MNQPPRHPGKGVVGHDVGFCNDQHDPDLVPDILSSIPISCPLLINCFAVLLSHRKSVWGWWGGVP